MSTPNVGDSLFIRRNCGSWGRPTFAKVTVEKVSPKGQLTVKWASGTTTRFMPMPDGKEVGGSKYHCDYLDTMPFAEREAYLALEQRVDAAVKAVAAVKAPEWSAENKASLTATVAELYAALDAARSLVEAI